MPAQDVQTPVNDSPDELLCQRDGEILTLTLNRPGRRNALSLSLLRQLDEALAQASEDASIRVAVIAGKNELAAAAASRRSPAAA